MALGRASRAGPPVFVASAGAFFFVAAFALGASCGGSWLTFSSGDAAPVEASAFDASVPEGDPPKIPIGLDAYRAFDELPVIRIGARTYMRSTYDRAGGNEAADASHFLREIAPGADVPLDVTGNGFVYFFRANHWHGSPWTWLVDGAPNVVSETSTATPDNPVASSTFLPGDAFPSPLALTYATTQGADVSWVPIGFTHSVALEYGRSHYGTGYAIYSLYDPGADLSQSVSTWSTASKPTPDVLSFLSSAGSDIAPNGDGVHVATGTINLLAGQTQTIADLAGNKTIRALRFTAPLGSEAALDSMRLRITWDGRALSSIDAPLPLFFGTGTFFNRSNAEYLVKSLPAVVHFSATAIEMSMYLPMPFYEAAHIELVGGATDLSDVGWEIRSVDSTNAPNQVGYLHATYHDHGTPTPGQDLVFLDTTTDEGGGDECGSFVGTSFIFSDQANFSTLEGDPRFFFDDSSSPQAQGTGTEEWGAGGDYWNGQTTTLALAGHPVGAPDAGSAMNQADLIESAYRFLIADSFPFGKNARITFEHGGADDSTDHYQSVVYWYGVPGACLVQTDALHVSDPADEASHAYASPSASSVDTLTSRYELGVDHVGATETFPATTDTGRHMVGTTEFSIALDPSNFGALLRRKLDYAFPDQRAEVYVGSDGGAGAFVDVGTWYVAGSNSCAFVDAASETGIGTPSIETSNRRWRDDEFILPRSATRGRSRIRVRIVFEPSNQPISPGETLPAQAWSEYRYTAFSWVLP